MKGLFNIPNLFTASNLMSGVISIIMAFSGRLDWACYFIFLGALFDFFDGFLARKLKIAGEMGKQLDSLADMVTFGVAPGILAFILLILGQFPNVYLTHFAISNFALPSEIDINGVISLTVQDFLHNGYATYGFWKTMLPFLGLAIPFFSMFRLAKFNLDLRQSESFIGLPTPANTIFFTTFPLLLFSAISNGEVNALIYKIIQPQFFLPLIFIMSFLLISEIPLFSLKFKDFKWRNNKIRFIFLISCLFLIPIFLIWSIPIIIILYLLLSLISNQIKNKINEI